MINHNSLASVLGNKCPFQGADANWVMPHPSYNFGRIPATILNLFNPGSNSEGLPADCLGAQADPVDKVVVIFIDAFGWNFVEQLRDHPFIQRFSQSGTLSAISTQFPSSTPVEVTTMMTGLPVAGHGILEIAYYAPDEEAVVNPFFGMIMDNQQWWNYDSVVASQLPFKSLTEILQQHGIPSTFFQSTRTSGSPYTRHLAQGAKSIPYSIIPTDGGSYPDLEQGVKNLTEAVNTHEGKGYFYFYYPLLDSVCHDNGPEYCFAKIQAKRILDELESGFFQKLSGQLGKTAVLFIADHGQTQIEPEKNIILNEIIRPDTKYLKLEPSYWPIKGTGGRRNTFIYAKEPEDPVLGGLLRHRLSGEAVIVGKMQALSSGLFGDPSMFSERFLSHLPDFFVLPKGPRIAQWNEPENKNYQDHGDHGGLSSDEMVIPFGICRF